MADNIISLRAEPSTYRRPTGRTDIPCTHVIATTDTGDIVAAVFLSERRARLFCDKALSHLEYDLTPSDPRYVNTTDVGWGVSGDPIKWRFDETVLGPINIHRLFQEARRER